MRSFNFLWSSRPSPGLTNNDGFQFLELDKLFLVKKLNGVIAVELGAEKGASTDPCASKFLDNKNVLKYEKVVIERSPQFTIDGLAQKLFVMSRCKFQVKNGTSFRIFFADVGRNCDPDIRSNRLHFRN